MNTSPLTEIVQVKQAAEADLLARPGVTGVDVGYKVVRGQITESVAIRVLVEQKRDVGPDETVPREIEGVPTDVIQRRYVLHPLSVPVEELTPLTDSGTYDPVKGGISIGPCRVVGGRVFAGTLGAVVRDRTSGSPLLLSNFHVMCVDTGWSAGDTVAQPSRVDGGNCPADVVGAVQRASLGGQVDCAVAALSGRRYVCEIAEIGAPTGTGTASLGAAVHKRGRTTGLSHGVVDSVDLTVALDYGNGLGRVTLAHQIGIRVDAARNPQFGNHGDSGSVVVNDARQVVGLYFAGTDDGSHGVANPIQAVLDALQVDLCIAAVKALPKELPDVKLKDQAPDKLVVKETAADKPEEGTLKKPEKFETEKLDKLPKIEKQEKSEKPELADHKAWKEIKFEKNEIKEHKHEKLEKNEIKEHKHEIKELAKDHKPEIKEVAIEKPLSDNKLAEKLADGKLAEIDPTGPLGPLGPLPLQPGFATTLEAQAGPAAVTPIKKIEKLELEKVSIKTEQKDTKLEHKDKNEKLEHKDKIEKIEHKDKIEKLEKHEPKEHKHEIKEHKPEIKELAKEVKELAKEIKEFQPEKLAKEGKEFQPEKLAKEGFPEKEFAEGKLEDKLAEVGPLQPAQPIEPAQPVQPGAAASGAPPAAAKTIEKLPAEKLVLKREKIEKLEHKEWKIEKFEHKEWKIESKEFIFEKLQFEQKLQDKLADTGPLQPGQVQPLQPGQASAPAAGGAGTIEVRVANLEAAVAQLSHFIPAELRPDLSRGALTNEPGGTEPGAAAPEAAAGGGDAERQEQQESREGQGGEPGGAGGSTGGQGGGRRGSRGGRGTGGGDHE